MISHYYRIVRFTNMRNFESYQVLERIHTLLGLGCWRTELAREDIPVWASIQRATLGSTEWQSKLWPMKEALERKEASP